MAQEQQAAVSDDDKKKVHKLQVWVDDVLFVKITERTRVTGKQTSTWIRGVLHKHFADAEGQVKKEDGFLDRLERLLARFKG